jgi:ankyrin repeat protein
VLGVNHPALPKSLPRRLLLLIRKRTELPQNVDAYCSIIVEFSNIISQAESSTFEAGAPFVFANQHNLDERSNAAIGLAALAVISSNTDLSALRKTFTTVALNWKPQSRDQPSTLEYLTAAGLMMSHDFTHLPKPHQFRTDAEVVSGFIMSHKASYQIAWEILTGCVEDLGRSYGINSLEYGMTVAELSNCCNILRKEDLAESWATRALQSRKTPELVSRSDWCFLSVARADSFIGRAQYEDAVPLLQEVLDNSSAPGTIAMVTALRLSKVHRRLDKRGDSAFEPGSALRRALSQFKHVPNTLKTEFFEETASSLSPITEENYEQTAMQREFIGLVDGIVQKQNTSLVQSPSYHSYIYIRQECEEVREEISPLFSTQSPREGKTQREPETKSLTEAPEEVIRRPRSSEISLWNLHSASRDGKIDTVRLLILEYNPDSRDKFGQTPLSLAAAYGRDEVVELLLATKRVDVNSKDRFGRTPLSWASGNGHKAVVERLLETERVDAGLTDEYNRAPILWAASNGHEMVVGLFLTVKRVNVDSRDKFGRTPLSRAAEFGHGAVVELLLKTERVDADFQVKYGRTPLSWAAKNGHHAVVKQLLAREGVDANLRDDFGWAPLSWAARNGHEMVVRLLLATEDVDLNPRDGLGETPLSWASKNEHKKVTKMLLAKEGVGTEADETNDRTLV